VQRCPVGDARCDPGDGLVLPHAQRQPARSAHLRVDVAVALDDRGGLPEGGHVGRQGSKPGPDQVDPHAWVHDTGENGDCSVDALDSENVLDPVTTFRGLPTAKASFATRSVDRDPLGCHPQGRTRIRFSSMPENDSTLVDIRTSTLSERTAAAEDSVGAGYEVHLDFSPVVLRDGRPSDWAELLRRLDDELPRAFEELHAPWLRSATRPDRGPRRAAP